ncbi:hypothetical protein [Dyella tabacisoli]|uniref:Uncharacterized protein n=1 Tax=Dyella tabacisoli TaxID=2282381 RepID=A0A369UQQ8_9GAMM|nr:hypothetical protein [Dyella tabacisoli]RDD82797.1 hypothetical protein DVJ77_04575 [Dyella tabacisoli]
MKLIAFALLVLASFCTTSCSQQALIDKVTPHPESEYAQDVIAELRAGQIDNVMAKLDPKRQTPEIATKLREIQAYFPSGKPKSIKVVGAHSGFHAIVSTTTKSSSDQRYGLVYEYEFEDSWAIVYVMLIKVDGKLMVDSINLDRMTQSLEQSNAFTFQGKGALHWIFAALVCVIPLFCLYAFITCLRTPMVKRKWLWAIFTLIGVVMVKLNWTTGDFDFHIVNFQLFSASAFAAPYSPWILAVSFPLGAVWFLIRRKSLMPQLAPVPLTAPPQLPKAES